MSSQRTAAGLTGSFLITVTDDIKQWSSFLWRLGGGRLFQDEAEHLFSSHWLAELIAVDNEHKLHNFFGQRMTTAVAADALGEEQKAYVV